MFGSPALYLSEGTSARGEDEGVDANTEHRAKLKPEAEHDFEGALIEVREDIGALGLMDNLDVYFDAEATKLGRVAGEIPREDQETARRPAGYVSADQSAEPRAAGC